MPTLPAGTVTFLFTDVEGSTRLWEQQPDAMAAAIARHDAILRRAIESCGGQVFRTAGDAFCAAFDTAAPAIAAAAHAQQALYAETWPVDQPLRVRMALHSTEAEPQDDGYGGGGLNRMGRLLAVCHGGQTLLTQASEQLVRDHLPAGASLLDLGQHQFRDLTLPDRIFQLVLPGLPVEFPPLKSLAAIPNNLPAQVTSFVGRERELARLVQTLTPVSTNAKDGRTATGAAGETRLLTLTGPGGTGKTRLSLQAAAELLDHFPDGVWFVELAPVSDPALVAQTGAAAVGLREIAGRPLDATLADYLRDKRLLLVLDNCEHLIDECARIADLLLRRCPDLRILASSRESLGIAGETVFKVPSLAIPDPGSLPPLDELARFESMQLFAQRAGSVQPAFRLTAQNAPAVAQIACRLDGIPLALELAAARVRSLSPEQIAARLDDRFRLLTGGSRAAVQRQQTLQALIDWSYDLLSPQECTLLRRLAVFAGGWTLEAAEGLCAWGDLDLLDVLDLLDSLVNKSLVGAESAGEQLRYRMQETVRQYAQDKLLAAGEAVEARTRHLAYFAATMIQIDPLWRTNQRTRSLKWVKQEADNLRSAVEWALETDLETAMAMMYGLGVYWPQVGSATECRRFIARALAQAEASPDPWYGDAADPHHQLLLAGAWFADGFAANSGGANPDTRSSMEKAIALLQQLGEKDRLAAAYGFAGLGAMFTGDFGTGMAYGRQSFLLARETGDRWVEAMQHISFGTFDLEEDSFANWEEGMAIMRELKDSWGEAMGYMVAGNAALRTGDLSAAKQHFERMTPLFEETGYVHMAHIGNSGLADIARLQGDYERALAIYRSIIRVWRLADQRGATARCLECVGFIYGLQAVDAAESLPLLRRAATLFAAADVTRRNSNSPMHPWEQTEYDGHLAALRGRLEPADFDQAWRAGQQMDLDQAVAYAAQESARQFDALATAEGRRDSALGQD